MYSNIPQELKELKQFVCWKLQETEGKPTKLPLNPRTGHLASVTDPSTWATFDEAVAAAHLCSGIGLVLTENDPFSCIDLDHTTDPDVLKTQKAIAEAFDSYQEISPSESGLHIWVKGSVPQGRKRSQVEIYSSGRYLTITGKVFNNSPIKDYHIKLNQLWAEMEVKPTNEGLYLNTPEINTDYEILTFASQAQNGQKFIDLYEGRWQEYFPNEAHKPEGCNEADQALVNIIAFYTQNREQIKRIFRASALGKRKKAQREDYFENQNWGMLNKAFDRQIPSLDMEGLKANLESQLNTVKSQAVTVKETQLSQLEAVKEDIQQSEYKDIKISKYSDITVPPGIVGEIAKFIYNAAPLPVPEIAIAGAIGLMCGVTGRSYNVSGVGLNQYVLMLGNTGCHAKGAEILMYDGSVKFVEDVVIGDKLMGPDSEARNVLSLARGNEQMVKVVPTKGDSFIVNINHILSLQKVKEGYLSKNPERCITNISVKDYIKQSKTFKHIHKLRRVGVTFSEWECLPLDPWFLGVMLGDGHFKGIPTLTSADSEIVEKCEKIVERFGVTSKKLILSETNKAFQYRFSGKMGNRLNKLTQVFNKLGLTETRSHSKFIPFVYKTASKTTRLKVLAGLLDSDGHLCSSNTYDFITKSEQLAKDVVFIARSLGLAAYLKPCEKYSQNKIGGVYYRVSISGNTSIIPCVVKNKQATVRLQKKDVLVTGFKIELLENDDFYGFSLDKDHLYLTSDFTIHHNTGKEGMASGIDRLINEVRKTVPAVTEFIGPSEIASAQALIKHISKTSKCFMSLVGEFCIKLQQISSLKANPHELGFRRVMLDLYNKSGKGKTLGQMIYSDKDKNTDVTESPTFSILGEGTPEKFYEILNKEMIEGGLLPRFLIIEYKGKRVEFNEHHLNVKPSQLLLDHFSALCAYSLQLNNGNNVIDVQIEKDALKMLNKFSRYCNTQINDASNEVSRQLWNRAHIKTLKLAATLAVGCNYINPTINFECATWALNLVKSDIENLLERFESGEIGTTNVQNDQITEIKKAFKRYVTSEWNEVSSYSGSTLITHSLKVIPFSFISSYCRQKTSFKNDKLGPIQALKTCLTAMLEADDIRELSPQDKRQKGLSATAKLFMISGMKI